MEQGPREYGFDANTCAAACSDYHYFALQDNGWCVCGNAYGTEPQYAQVDDSQCGGIASNGRGWRNSIYENTSYDYSEDRCNSVHDSLDIAWENTDGSFMFCNGIEHLEFDGVHGETVF